MKYFHFTLGPVQDFVAQARRSKDLWAGSFLLSWLSAVAILAVRNQGSNTIQFPLPNEEFLSAVAGNPDHEPPKQGGIPNRFKGLVVQVEDDFNAQAIVQAVQQAWQALAQLVWEKDVLPALTDSDYDLEPTLNIWQRQVQGFWEMSWVITEHGNIGNLLDRRKNWRSHYRFAEPGDKCMVMAGFQELSAQARPGKEVSQFWQHVRQHCDFGDRDFAEREQLCALAFIKRRFARYFDQLEVSVDCGGRENINIKGWSFASRHEEDYDPNTVPSLPYLAALPWLRQAMHAINEDEALDHFYSRFASASAKLMGLPSANVKFQCLNEQNLPLGYIGIDGSSFFPLSLAAAKGYRHEDSAAVIAAFNDFKQRANLPDASPFYAILLMDGDSLGAQMSSPNKQKPISSALNAFTNGVADVVMRYDGFLCYAGGDDVLALMPMDSAITCAYALKKLYERCINEHRGDSGLVSTLSGAIQFAHMKSPLMNIISGAHHLLDDVAKDQTGRDSLAIRINKPGGVHAQWSMPWSAIYGQDDTSILDQAVAVLDTEQQLSNSVLYKLIQLLDQFSGTPDQMMKLAVAQYCQSELGVHISQTQQAEVILKALLDVCAVNIRDPESKRVSFQHEWNYDGLKLIRFLASKGIEREGL